MTFNSFLSVLVGIGAPIRTCQEILGFEIFYLSVCFSTKLSNVSLLRFSYHVMSCHDYTVMDPRRDVYRPLPTVYCSYTVHCIAIIRLTPAL